VCTQAVGSTADDESITSLLIEFTRGNRNAENRLIRMVYGQLRVIASACMRRERGNHTLQPTALINEAWLRLADQPNITLQNRAHFFALASKIMRRVLVDHARRRRAEKRPGARHQVTLQDHLLTDQRGQRDLADMLALDQALERLKGLEPRACRVAELHFFGGLTFEEMELVLGVSNRTLKRDWDLARGWLRTELSRKPVAP
jgi:RNA polymerase sigma factor (TIGR02999 family)